MKRLTLWLVPLVTCGLFVYVDTSHAHGAPNWGPDEFGDRDGVIEIYRDGVNFRGVLAQEIRQYNRQRPTLFPDEDKLRQVRSPEEAEVLVHTYPERDFACGGFALVWVGFEVKDEVGISDGCFDYMTQFGDAQPLRGTLLHEVVGHLNGIHHHEACDPFWQSQTVMVSGVNNGGCGVPLRSLGPHDVDTLAGPR